MKEIQLTPELDKLFEVTNNLKKSERALRVPGTDRKENSAEHSWELAMVAWYLIETYQIKLDLLTVFKYALPHDIGEWKHGDVSAFDKTLEDEIKEELAIIELMKEFELWTAPCEAHLYEQLNLHQDVPEARFVHFVDRFVGNFNAYLDNMSMILERTPEEIGEVAFDFNYEPGIGVTRQLFDRMMATYHRVNQLRDGQLVL